MASKFTYHAQAIPSPLEKAGGAIYRQSVFTKEEFSTISKEVARITSNRLNEEKSSIAQHRLGASLPPDSETARILKEGSLFTLVKRLAQDSSLELSTHLPVEVRLYETVGSGMAWHIDDVLYDPTPQLEVVITLENNSDCCTLWKNEKDKASSLLHSQETDPNSALILQAGGPLHCVTSLKRGRRLILKCAYASRDATFREGVHADQFGGAKGKTKKRKHKR